MLDVVWVVVSDSKSVLMSSEMLHIDKSSLRLNLRLDLELGSILEWVFWEVNTFGADLPTLSSFVIAVDPSNLSVVDVNSTLNLQASSTWVSQVSGLSWVE